MKKTIIAILVMLQLFFYALVNARTYFGYDVHGNMLVSIEVCGYRFNYTQHDERDNTIY